MIGLLREDGSVDIPRMRELVELALPMLVTFHRAFDMTADPFQALRDIKSIQGIQRILTRFLFLLLLGSLAALIVCLFTCCL